MSISPRDNTTARVPEFVYANNGAKYHPCLYCCRAFAHKRYLSLHMKACVRTHLQEVQQNGSVSVNSGSPSKPNQLTMQRATPPDVILSDEITIRKTKMEPEMEETANDAAPAAKRSKRYESTEKADDNNQTNAKMDVRRFSMENACKLCDEIFSSLDELIMHAKIEHNQRTKDTKTFSPEDIEYFLRVFTKMNKSHCPICRKAILNTLNWRGHLYTHCTVRKFACKICGKLFTRGDHCKYHEMRHKHGSPMLDEDEDEGEEVDVE